MSTPIRIKRSAVPGKIPAMSQLELGELGLNTYDAELYTIRERAGIGSEVVKLTGTGVTVTNILYVTADGKDTNTGLKLGEAKRTIGAAVTAATTGTVIKIAPGTYVENNPLILPKQISLVGDTLREVSVSPQNPNQDFFYVAEGNYITEMSFTGSLNPGKALFAFNPNPVGYTSQSPYIRNCTNFIPNSIGMKIDGSKVIGPIKSMVTDSFTQYNQGGIGVSITNEGYAQLVSLFTICNDTAVYCGSGGACDLTNSNSSFGNYGLVADGVGPLKYTGVVTSYASANSDTFTLNLNTPTINVINAGYTNVTGIVSITTSTAHNFSTGMSVRLVGLGFSCLGNPGAGTTIYPSGAYGYVFDVISVGSTNTFSVNVGPSNTPNQVYIGGGTVTLTVPRPFDGQTVYFDQLYNTVDNLNIISGGSGYNTTPIITIDPPTTSWGVQAQATVEISNGSIVAIVMISNGRGYTSTPNVRVSAPDVGINTSILTAKLLPSYYTIKSSTPIVSGICTVTLNDNVPYAVGVGSTVPFFKQSRVLSSGHSFEYIGSGVTIANALPSAGGVPIQANETDARNGGLVVYTSTDQSGNFRIGDGVAINQATGTISGVFYSKSLFSTMTPFILALGGE